MKNVKFWHFLWILWLILAVVNVLFVNVYINHFGVETAGVKALTDVQALAYLGLTLLLLAVVGIWWILVGNSKSKKGIVALGAIVTAIFGLALIGSVVYQFAFDGAYIRVAVEFLAEKLAFLSF